MTDLMTKVSQLAGAREAERAARYRELVLEVADGGEPDPNATVDILEAAGKTPSDLQSDLRTIQNRRRLAADVEAGKVAANERLIIPQQIEEANAVLAAAQQTHRATVGPLQAELQRLLTVEAAGRTAGTDLEKTAPEAMKTKLSLAVSRREHATGQRDIASTAVVHATRKFDQHSAYVDQLAGVGPAVARMKGLRELAVEQAELARLKTVKEAAEATLAEAQKALDAATAAEAQIRDQLRVADVF